MANLNIDLNLLINKANANLDKLTKQANVATSRFSKLERGVGGVNSNLKLLTGVVASIGLVRLGQGILSLGDQSLGAAGKIETMTTQFEVLTQSTTKANAIMKDLVEFTAKTPFQLEGVAKAGQRLISFGFEVDSIQDKLQVLGDVSAASGADLGEMALIFGQVRAAGKLTGERLLQLQERAIPIGPALAKTMGITESAVKEMVTQGKVDFKTFEKAFESLNDAGQFAFEGMIKRSKTLEGRTSTLKDNMNLLSSDIGTKMLPAYKGLITAATIAVDKIRKNAEVMEFFGNIAKNIPGIVQTIADTLIMFNNIIQETRKFINTLRAGFNAMAVGAIDVVIAMNDAAIAVNKFLGQDTSAIEANNESLRSMKDTFTEVAVESLAANDAIEKSQIETNKTIIEGSKFLIKTIDEEIKAAQAQAEEKIELNKRVDASSKALTAEQLKDIEARRQAQEKLNEQLAAARQMVATQKEANRLFDSEAETLFQEERLIKLEEFFTREQEATLQATLNAITNETEKQLAIENIVASAEKRKLKNKEKALADEKKAEETAAKNLIANRRTTGATIATLATSNNKTLASIGKAATVAQIAIDTPKAVSTALAAFPPPFNFVAAGLVAAAMAVQASKAAGLNFAQGGFVPGNSFTGDRVQANVNSGEAILNSRQQRNFMSLANGAGGAGATNNAPVHFTIRNVVELDGQQITESVSTYVADGFELGAIV